MKKRRGLKGDASYLQTLNVLQENVTNSLIISFNVRVGTALPEIENEIGPCFTCSNICSPVDVRAELLFYVLHMTGCLVSPLVKPEKNQIRIMQGGG